MRQLTQKQKKLLDAWIDENYHYINRGIIWFDWNECDQFPIELYEQLEEINDTEILYQEVNRYVADKVSDMQHERMTKEIALKLADKNLDKIRKEIARGRIYENQGVKEGHLLRDAITDLHYTEQCDVMSYYNGKLDSLDYNRPETKPINKPKPIKKEEPMETLVWRYELPPDDTKAIQAIIAQIAMHAQTTGSYTQDADGVMTMAKRYDPKSEWNPTVLAKYRAVHDKFNGKITKGVLSQAKAQLTTLIEFAQNSIPIAQSAQPIEMPSTVAEHAPEQPAEQPKVEAPKEIPKETVKEPPKESPKPKPKSEPQAGDVPLDQMAQLAKTLTENPALMEMMKLFAGMASGNAPARSRNKKRRATQWTEVDVPTISFNEEKKGIEIRFPEKPDDYIRQDLISNGFKWSGYYGCWYAPNTPERQQLANEIIAGMEVSQ